MDNKNLNNIDVNQAKKADFKAKRNKRFKYIIYISIFLLLFVSVTYLSYKNPQLFKADIQIENESDTIANAGDIFIPNYTSLPSDNGQISINTKADLHNIYSIEFKLKWSPSNAIKLNKDSIVFDDETVFKTAVVKTINTSKEGEAIIALFVADPINVTADSNNVKKLIKLNLSVNAQSGEKITLSGEDLQFVVDDGNGSYNIDQTHTTISSGSLTIGNTLNLRLLNAEALDKTHVLLEFNDLLSNRDFSTCGLKIVSSVDHNQITLNVDNAESAYDYDNKYNQNFVVLKTEEQIASERYTVSAENSCVLGNTKGAINPDYAITLFDGFPDAPVGDEILSDAVLSKIDVDSPTQITLHFSKPINMDTLTEVNATIKTASGVKLTITNIDIVDSSTAILTTAIQTEDTNYFITFNKVKDGDGNSFLNTKILNFFGFVVPDIMVNNISPSLFTNEADKDLTIMGQNLDIVDSVILGQEKLSIIEQSKTALTITVPAGFTKGIYDLKLKDSYNYIKEIKSAITVNNAIENLRIIDEESKSIPYNVAPDGSTEVTFWVLVADPSGIDDVDKVTIDLGKIGGNRAQEMEKDSGLQKYGQQFYKFTTTVAENTATSTEEYLLPVQVTKGSEHSSGTVSILVTRDLIQSVPPVFEQVYISPSTIAPDNKTEAKISAKISDADGASTIDSVVAELGELGLGFIKLDPINVAGQSDEATTSWYESSPFKISETVQEKTYTIKLTASDKTGEIANSDLTVSVSSALTGPKIDSKYSYIEPRKSVPKDGKTPFSINTMVSDPNGMSDIDTVTAYFTTLGIKPINLYQDSGSSSSAKKALFSSDDIVVPTTTPLGTHEIEVIATDKEGGTANLILQIDVTTKDLVGDAPIIFDKKSYTSPKIAINDGKTPINLYVFVRDDDNDLESVAVNLAGIAQIGPENDDEFEQVSTSNTSDLSGDICKSSSSNIVCMNADFKEGNDGQWFVLPNLTISKSTKANNEAYELEVIATDATGKIDRGKIKIFVQDSSFKERASQNSNLIAAVSIGKNAIELLFDSPLSAMSLKSGASQFEIIENSNISNKLSLFSASINADGNIITLNTDDQESAKLYNLTISDTLKGIGDTDILNKKVKFKGFESLKKLPIINNVSAISQDTIEIEFQNDLRLSSVKTGQNNGKNPSDFDIKIFEADNTSVSLPVYSVNFLEDASTLEVKTDKQKSTTKYRVQINNIASADGYKLKTPIMKTFKSIKSQSVQTNVSDNQADLNGDGIVDFIDFTIFSYMYGQHSTSLNTSNTSNTNLNSISPDPDSTVSHTSKINN